jgi:hypothetical protein
VHELSARQTVDPPLEEFTIFGTGGEAWRALRQPLGGGIYRTPDDPTTLEDLIDARITLMRDRELQEQIEEEFRTLSSGA